MLDRVRHEVILRSILRDIYKETDLSTKLGFKGGTCLYFFYNLPRFSTDLDFNQIEAFNPEFITKIVKEYIDLEDFYQRTNTLFWLGSYEKGKQKIKIEISQRNYPDEYTPQNFFGISINTMGSEYMFAHKLCAVTDRKTIQNRDLFDTWFMLKENFPISEQIVQIRTENPIVEYLKEIVKVVKNLGENHKVLSGLGEVLDKQRKDWVRDHLINELLFELDNRIIRYT